MKVRVPRLVRARGGTFWMGSRSAPYPREAPCHQVIVPTFSLGLFPVTRDEFQDFLSAKADEPGETIVDQRHDPIGSCPASDITWTQATEYCGWLARITGEAFRLPTEAEWEYAAKAGLDLQYPTATGGISSALANYDSPGGAVTPVGSYPPNPFGLYDMAGNVWEWCNSKKGDYSAGRCVRSYSYPYDATDGREDATGPGTSRVLRGGCYGNKAINCRSAARYREFSHRSSNCQPSRGRNTFGFRVAR